MTNPLVAEERDSTTAITGIGIVESAADVTNGIQSGSWAEIGIGAAGLGLETLSIAMDPAGALLSAGVAWLMEHVEPLSQILDQLAGNADAVASHAATWRNVAQAVGEVATDFGPAVAADTAGWTGSAADAYRTRGASLTNLLSAASTASGGVGSAIEMAGMIVGIVREVVRDLIADLVGRLIAWAAEVAFTLGLATPVVVAQATSAIAKWAARIAEIVRKLIRTINNLIPLLRRLDEVFASIRQAVDSFASTARRADAPTSPSSPSSPDTPNAPGTTTPSSSPGATSPQSTPTSTSPASADPSTTSPTTTSPPTTTDTPTTDTPTTATTPGRPHDGQFHHSDRDPLRQHGSAQQTHPQEWTDALAYARERGVEVIERPGTMAYGPSPSPGQPGQLIIDPDASVGALRHEMQHLLDDEAAGWPGMRAMFEDPERAFQMEVRAYQREIEYAESIGDFESAEILRGFIEQERVRWLGGGE